MKAVLLAASLALATASTAAAQPGMTPPSSPPPQAAQPPLPPPPAQQGEPVSENVALALSLGGTAAAWSLFLGAVSQGNSSADLALLGLAGAVFAPSFGHSYAHSPASRGLGLRLGGAAALVLSLAMLIVACEDECNDAPMKGTAIVGMGLIVAGTIDDIATVRSEARRYNQRFQNVSLVPMVRHGTGGLALTGRF